MFAKRKAQAAMEFLMTYGWAILVVLIAIGALAYFGVLSPDRFLPEKCVIATGSGLFCDDYAAADNQVELILHNILAEQITVSEISIEDSSDNTNDCAETFSSANTIDADGKTTFTVDDASCAWIDSDAKVKADVTIEYTVGTGGLDKTTSGSLSTVAG